jgi:hypothetical protein
MGILGVRMSEIKSMTADESTLRSAINEAMAKYDHVVAARLWGELCDLVPGYDDDHYHLVEGLWRIHDWDRAEAMAAAARSRFPQSELIEYAYAFSAFLRCDWQECAARFECLRRRFDPAEFHYAKMSIFWQLAAYGEMLLYSEARRLIREQWPMLRLQDPPAHSALLLMHLWIDPCDAEEFVAWSTAAIPKPQQKFYTARLRAAVGHSESVMSQTRPIEIVSLGQSCLPFVVPLRWGLLPNVFCPENAFPFDLLGSVEDTSSIEIRESFKTLLDPEDLIEQRFNNTPMLMNRRLGCVFFHEKGPWWKENHWERLHISYGRRIANFMKVKNEKIPALFIFCLSGRGSAEMIIDTYIAELDHNESRLLLINVLAEPLVNLAAHPRVTILNHPYSADYDWNDPQDYDSAPGHEFELKIISTIVECIDEINGSSAQRID